MTAHLRTAATLVVLGAIVVFMAVWGWGHLTAPFPGKVQAAACEEKQVTKGTRISPDQVTVSVYNAGDRSGLANRTMDLFTGQGFGAGDLANAPEGADVKFAQIWTRQPGSPAVALVQTRLGPKSRVVKKPPPGPGVSVIVGNGFNDLKRGKKHVVSRGTYEICMPPS